MKSTASWKHSLVVAGYEIPNPHASIFVVHTVVAVAPAAMLAAAHKPIGVAAAIAVGVGLFQLRNVVVRAENARGIHAKN
jgi:hypothetical protein